MKVLQVNCVYKAGSTGKITYDLHNVLIDNGIDSVVCYGRGGKYDEPNVIKTCGELYAHMNHFLSNITGILYGGCRLSTRRLERVIKSENPDIVHLQCINGYFVNIYSLLKWLKTKKYKTILTIHAEFMYTGGCGYSFDCERWMDVNGCGSTPCPQWKKSIHTYFFNRSKTMWKRMKEAVEGFDLDVVSVSPWLMERAEKSIILGDKRHHVVLNGLDTSVFHYYNSNDLRAKYKLEDKKIILFVAPYFEISPDHIKGAHYIRLLAEELNNSDGIKFIVIGGYSKEIEYPPNMIMVGEIRNPKELARFYSLADVTVLASRRETFSMITAESLSCGTPIVGFKAGAPEMIAIEEFSEFVEYGDLTALKQSVLKWLHRDNDKVKISEKSKVKYAKETMGENYIDIYKQLIDGVDV